MPADNNFQDDNATAALEPLAVPAPVILKPFAVSIAVAQALMGNKARSEVYEAIAKREVDAVKDGDKTLVVLSSIERRQAALPPADIKMSPRVRPKGTPSVKTGKRQVGA